MQPMSKDYFLKCYPKFQCLKKDTSSFHQDIFSIISKDDMFNISGHTLNDEVYFYNINFLNYSSNIVNSLQNQIMNNYLFFRNCIREMSSVKKILICNLYQDNFQNKEFEIIYKGFIDNDKPVFFPHVKISKSKSFNNLPTSMMSYEDLIFQDITNNTLFERTFFNSEIEGFKVLNENIFNLYIKPILEIDIKEFNKEHIKLLKMIDF